MMAKKSCASRLLIQRCRAASMVVLCAAAAGSPVRAGGRDPPIVLAQATQDESTGGLFRKLMARLTEEDDGGDRVNAAGRGSDSGPMAMPLLAGSGRQSMVIGTRPFHLAWTGGKPPYKVRVTGPSGDVDAAWQPAGKRAVAATITLEEGSYEVVVTDAGGQSVLGEFDAVAQAPSVDAQTDASLSADQKRVVLAARLATVEDGAWQLEAYQQLAAVPDSQAAAITARRLAAGRSIADLGEIDTQ